MTCRWVPAATAGLLALALTGCAARTSSDPGPRTGPTDGPTSPSDQTWPAGRTFLSTALTDHGAARTLVAGTRIELTFTPDRRIEADAGCNHLGASGRLDAGRLVITELSSTLIGCPPAKSEQDQWLATILSGTPQFTLAGDSLTLAGDGSTIELTDRRVAEPDYPVVGSYWVADTIVDGVAASSVPAGALGSLTIAADGTFAALTGCVGGRLSGTADVQDGHITFSAVQATPCTDAGNALDVAMRATLAGDVAYTVSAKTLMLSAADDSGVGFTANG